MYVIKYKQEIAYLGYRIFFSLLFWCTVLLYKFENTTILLYVGWSTFKLLKSDTRTVNRCTNIYRCTYMKYYIRHKIVVQAQPVICYN